MSITELAIHKRQVTFAALVVAGVAGIQAYTQLPQAEDPGFIIRTAQVTTRFPGASPERVEELVTDKLEKAIQEIPQVDFITSTSKPGLSVILVNIQERYKVMRPIWDDLRRKVDRARADLPEGVVTEVNDEFGDVFGTILALTGEGYTYAELDSVAEAARDELLLIDEVAKVHVYGVQEERVFVEYQNARLAELGLSTAQLREILEARNIITPGGAVYTDDEAIVLEPTGAFESVAEIGREVIRAPASPDLLYLQDLATIRRGYVDPPSSLARANGDPALVLAVSLREGGNIIALGEAVRRTVQRLAADYPIGLDLDVIAFQADIVRDKVDDFVGNVLQAVVIVMLVMLITLGLRTGLVVSTLIPMSMLVALVFMGVFGIGIDQMSLASLIIALGMLVDNAIVMAESIMVQIAGGKDRLRAAIDSAAELRIPLLTSSLTTAAAFLPIFLAKSGTGEYTAPLFKVVTITLLSSWVLSLTMIPLLCYLFLRVTPEPADRYETRFYRAYRSLLRAAVHHRGVTLGATLGLFLLALGGMRLLPVIFFPPNDRATATGEVFTPAGSPIDNTVGAVVALEAFIRDSLLVGADRPDGVTSWATFIGQGGPRFYLSYRPEPPNPEHAYFLLNASTRDEVDRVTERLNAHAFATLPGLSVRFNPMQLGPPVDWPVQVRLTGRDPDRLFAAVAQVAARVAEVPGTREVEDDWGRRTKKIVVRVDQPRARRAGVTSQDIAMSLQTVMSGFATTEYREGTDVIPVMLRSVAADREDLGKIEGLNVYAQATERSVPLKQVADLEVVWQPAKILRRDRLWTVTVQAELVPGRTASAVNAELRPWFEEVARSEWRNAVTYAIGGAEEEAAESNASIMAQLPIAGLIIVLLLVGQFNGFRKPVIILLTIPLGVIGVTAGLLITGSYFGFMTLLGIISLAGIVINNAIVLLDRIQYEIDVEGRTPAAAILEAGQRRLRPILLTTGTTVGGLVPLWLGGGPMWEPMAIAIIFGLLFATILTLGVVPVLYALLYRVSFDAPSA